MVLPEGQPSRHRGVPQLLAAWLRPRWHTGDRSTPSCARRATSRRTAARPRAPTSERQTGACHAPMRQGSRQPCRRSSMRLGSRRCAHHPDGTRTGKSGRWRRVACEVASAFVSSSNSLRRLPVSLKSHAGLSNSLIMSNRCLRGGQTALIRPVTGDTTDRTINQDESANRASRLLIEVTSVAALDAERAGDGLAGRRWVGRNRRRIRHGAQLRLSSPSLLQSANLPSHSPPPCSTWTPT